MSRTFRNYWGKLDGRDGHTGSVAAMTGAYADTDDDLDLASLAPGAESTGTGYTRQTVDLVWDDDLKALKIDPADVTFDLSDEPNLKGFAVTDDDDGGKLVTVITYDELEAGTDGWTFAPDDAVIAYARGGGDLAGRVTALESTLDTTGATTGQVLTVATPGGRPAYATPSGGGGSAQVGYVTVAVEAGVADLAAADPAAGYAVLPEEPFTLNLPAPEDGMRLVVLVGAPPEALAGLTVAGDALDVLALNAVAPSAEFFAMLLVPTPDLGSGPSWSVTYTPQSVVSSWESTLFFGSDITLDGTWASTFGGVKVEAYESDTLVVLFGKLDGGTSTTLMADVAGTPLEGNTATVLVSGEIASVPIPVLLSIAAPGSPQALTATGIDGSTPDVVFLDGVTLIR